MLVKGAPEDSVNIGWWHQAITWTILKEVLWHSLYHNSTRNVQDIYHWDVFENYTFEIAAVPLSSRWVKKKNSNSEAFK